MKNQTPIEIIDRLLELNNDRVIIYSLVKNEIVYEDLKTALSNCIKRSLLCSAQLVKERNRIVSKENYETLPNQDFFNVWLVINESLSDYKRGMINSLFAESETVFKSTYENALNKQNIKHLSSRHKSLIGKQRELLNAA
jgi:hypothetical protein